MWRRDAGATVFYVLPTLCAGGLGFGSGVVLALAWDVCTGLEVVVFGQAVGAKMQMMDAALDSGFGASALIADSSFWLGAGASMGRIGFGPIAGLHVKTGGGEDHTHGEDHAASAEEGGIAWCGECGREKTQAGKGEEAADCNHPASKFQSH
jgi:hypothetical protein